MSVKKLQVQRKSREKTRLKKKINSAKTKYKKYNQTKGEKLFKLLNQKTNKKKGKKQQK